MNWWQLKRKIHISWLIAIMSFFIFVGVYIAQYVNVRYFLPYSFLAIAIILMIISLWRKYIYLIPFIIIGSILFGLWRGSISQNDLSQFIPLYGQIVSVEGQVKEDVDIGPSNQMIIRLDNLIINDKSLPGMLWVTAMVGDIKRGDRINISGKLVDGFGSFAATIYWANVNKINHSSNSDIGLVIRDWFAGATSKAIPSPESNLGLGFLVCQRRSLPADLVLALQVAGLTHIVVASGYNLTILVRLARRFFIRVSKYVSLLSSVVMMILFIAITGISPSMMRAGLVTGLSLAAWYYGRKFHPIALLSLVIAITVVINPSYAWGDLGWQLSFAAFAGVMIVAPLLQRYLFGNQKPGFVQQILIETISAQIVTAPILISAFGQLSNVAIISNILILPLVPLAMLLTFIAGIGSLIVPAVAVNIAMPATWLLGYMIGIAEYLSSLPWAISDYNLTWWGLVICYCVIIAACVYMWRVTKYNLREVNLVE